MTTKKKSQMSTPSTSVQATRPQFSVNLTKNSYISITWARAKESEQQDQDGRTYTSPVIAEFSANLVVDGVIVAAWNQMKLLSFVDEGTGDERLQIGSMAMTYRTGTAARPVEKKIYAVSMFPGDHKDNFVASNRDSFSKNTAKAVMEFIAAQAERMKQEAEKPAPERPMARQMGALRQNFQQWRK